MSSNRDHRIAGGAEYSEGQQAYSVVRKQLIILGIIMSGLYASLNL
jgi:hypothetical protein